METQPAVFKPIKTELVKREHMDDGFMIKVYNFDGGDCVYQCEYNDNHEKDGQEIWFKNNKIYNLYVWSNGTLGPQPAACWMFQ